MAKKQRKYWIVLGLLFFTVYLFTASAPIPKESVLIQRWIVSLDSPEETVQRQNTLVPFQLGGHFGYVDESGMFSINRKTDSNTSLSSEAWTEYDSIPESFILHDPYGSDIYAVNNPDGYPYICDDVVFIIGSDQTTLTTLDKAGNKNWTFDFPSPLTSLDTGGSIIAAGTLDGSIYLLHQDGRLVHTFEPGGSRLSVILSVRISADDRHVAVISGIDSQRFLLLERFSDSYKVVYHEYLETGFRRPVFLSFIANDTRLIFEREQALGLFHIDTFSSSSVPFEGTLIGLEEDGSDGRIFLLQEKDTQVYLSCIRYPDARAFDAAFTANDAYIYREGSLLYVGGDSVLSAFEIGER